MANYATNLLFASTENEKDLEKMEKLMSENFDDCNVDWYGECIDVDFSSRWRYPEGVIDEIINSLEDKDKIYVRILTFELASEYVSFRIFSNGEWNIMIET